MYIYKNYFKRQEHRRGTWSLDCRLNFPSPQPQLQKQTDIQQLKAVQISLEVRRKV